MASIPASFRDLFDEQTFAHLSTIDPDGLPHVTPVWVDYDEADDRVEINTVRGRQKEQNISQNPKVGLSMLDPEDPYRYISVMGEVDEMTEEGAVEHIDALAKRYMGVDTYPNHDADDGPRIIVRIRPDRVVTSE